MSGLVGYESSSDEEAPGQLSPHVVPFSKSHDAPNNAPTGTKDLPPQEDQGASVPAASSDEGLVEPLLGPAVEQNGTFVTEEELLSPVALTDMSERDAIRHLSQATIPATSLPPSPPGSPEPAANERFNRFLELKAKGIHFNEDLARKTAFRNPSLLSSMMSKYGIDEKAQYSTSLPLDLWDPTDFPAWVYKEGLLQNQQDLQGQSNAKKRMLSATGKRTIDFAPETTSGHSSRKSTPGQSSKRRRP